ncbi:MAG: transglutaminase domain-containing protein [Deltaproteobacteria bacterium]|nr:transglutaminase domain-containing protein [Deltaproteobacteria bacterium]
MKSRRERLFDLFGYAAILTWLVMMGVLVKRYYFRPPPVTLSAQHGGSAIAESESWMAIYREDEKIGFSHSHIIQNSKGYIVAESAVMNLRAIGDVHKISIEMIGHLNQDASLRSFVFILDSGMVRFEARGRVEGSHLVVNTGLGGDEREWTIELKETPFLSLGLWPNLMKKGLNVGERYHLSLFDPSLMAQRPVEVSVVGRETIVLDGRKWDALKVKTIFAGSEVFAWIGPNGERLKEEGFMGLRMVKATEEDARIGIQSQPEGDITEMASVPSNKVLAEPTELVYLKVQLDGVDPEGLDLNSGRQRLTDSVLEVTLESGEPHHVGGQGQFDAYLEAGPFIQSDHPKVKALADQIVGQGSQDAEKARRILDWVYQSLEKRATVSVPNALDTLKTRAGDCNEHAMLLAALLRASGIPAKVCVGLVYTRGRFYYHAWNELYLGGWITADALMGQMPADVTHIKFVEGALDRQAEMLRVIGQVKLTVLEARSGIDD